jgi:origin recognition complex subunit 2
MATSTTNDDAVTDDNDSDLRKAAHLRYHFHQKPGIWTHIQSVGWKYKAGDGYQAPNSDLTLSANDTLRKLNLAAIVPLDNYLQIPPVISPVDKWSEQLRTELMNAIPSKELMKTTAGGGTKDSTTITTASIAPSASANTTTNTVATGSRRQEEIKKKGRSATTFDAGADLFLSQATKKRKKRKTNKKLILGGNEPQPIVKTELEFPTAIQIAEVYDDTIESSSLFQANEKKYEQSHYADWRFLLTTNHSLLLYGFGSKENLLNDFWKTTLKPVGDVLAIDGYDRTVSVKDVLDLLVQLYLDDTEFADPEDDGGSSDSTTERAKKIGSRIAQVQLKRKQPLYLVIHNIDGFRNREEQYALSMLLHHGTTTADGVRTIRLVASVDHVNASTLLWDPATSAAFSFIWTEVNTFRPYIEELKRGTEETKWRQSKRTKSLANAVASTESIYEILNTIANKHTEVLKTIIELQIDNPDKPVRYDTCLKACTNKMIVTSDSNLRKFLTELKDHGIVDITREGGREMLRVPHSAERLQEILDFNI